MQEREEREERHGFVSRLSIPDRFHSVVFGWFCNFMSLQLASKQQNTHGDGGKELHSSSELPSRHDNDGIRNGNGNRNGQVETRRVRGREEEHADIASLLLTRLSSDAFEYGVAFPTRPRTQATWLRLSGRLFESAENSGWAPSPAFLHHHHHPRPEMLVTAAPAVVGRRGLLACFGDRRALAHLVQGMTRVSPLPFLDRHRSKDDDDDADANDNEDARLAFVWCACMTEMDRLHVDVDHVESLRAKTEQMIEALLESFETAHPVRGDPRLSTIRKLIANLNAKTTRIRSLITRLVELQTRFEYCFPRKQKARTRR